VSAAQEGPARPADGARLRSAAAAPGPVAPPGLWQPTLRGEGFVATPLAPEDFEDLFTAASDPGIWAMHPVRDRHERRQFEIFFRTGIESRGALLFRDPDSGEVVGSSRFCDHDPARRVVEIGYTFLVRSRWGTGLNERIKASMLEYAYARVDLVEFVVGAGNLRSRRAVEKLGAELLRTISEHKPEGDLRESVVYGLREDAWRAARRR
jgi:RimJ/RimL family protein N-acetyltransferase